MFAGPHIAIAYDDDFMNLPFPLPDELGSWFEHLPRRCGNGSFLTQFSRQSLKLPSAGLTEAAMRFLLASEGNAADQHIPADPRRRRHPVEFGPLLAEFVRVETS